MKVVIIGAGPGGLVTCKYLLEAATPEFPFDPVILEQEDDIGGTFRYRAYEDATMVSSKQLTAFSDFRMPRGHTDYFLLKEYVQYLREYCIHFNVEQRIQTRCKVVRVSRDSSGGHCVAYVRRRADNSEWDTTPTTIYARYLVVCTGLHVTPDVPDIPGIEHVLEPKQPDGMMPEDGKIPRAVFHSVAYKGREQLKGRRVMILGVGETGLDLAYQSVKAQAKEVVLCTRGGFLSFPKILNNISLFGFKFASERPIPVDTYITNLFETAYVHPWVEKMHLRWILSDYIVGWVFWLLTGTSAGWNQWVGELGTERLGRAHGFVCKSHRAMPYINRPYRKPRTFWDLISHHIEPMDDSPPQTNFVVDLAPWPTRFLSSGRAVFPKSERKDAIRMAERDVRPDTVIYATGYRGKFDFLDEDYPTPSEANVRNVVRTGDEDVAFIGFLRPGLGAIPPLAEIQAMFWIALVKGQVRRPLPAPNYYLLVADTARLKYGVDHSLYMSTIAKDIGAAPGLWELWWKYGTHVFLCYCFGAAFSPFYRLVGPYPSPCAPNTIKGELWETITRRGVLGNIFICLIPTAFYLMVNAFVYVADFFYQIFAGGDKAMAKRAM